MTDSAGRWVTAQVGRCSRSVNEIAIELGCDWHTITGAAVAYGTALVERWFAELTTKKLQRSAHRCTKDLAAWNENPKPFIWHETSGQILDSLEKTQSNF